MARPTFALTDRDRAAVLTVNLILHHLSVVKPQDYASAHDNFARGRGFGAKLAAAPILADAFSKLRRNVDDPGLDEIFARVRRHLSDPPALVTPTPTLLQIERETNERFKFVLDEIRPYLIRMPKWWISNHERYAEAFRDDLRLLLPALTPPPSTVSIKEKLGRIEGPHGAVEFRASATANLSAHSTGHRWRLYLGRRRMIEPPMKHLLVAVGEMMNTRAGDQITELRRGVLGLLKEVPTEGGDMDLIRAERAVDQAERLLRGFACAALL